jgi:hypothetical protein
MDDKLFDITPFFEVIGATFIALIFIRGAKSILDDFGKIKNIKKEKLEEDLKNA